MWILMRPVSLRPATGHGNRRPDYRKRRKSQQLAVSEPDGTREKSQKKLRRDDQGQCDLVSEMAVCTPGAMFHAGHVNVATDARAAPKRMAATMKNESAKVDRQHGGDGGRDHKQERSETHGAINPPNPRFWFPDENCGSPCPRP